MVAEIYEARSRSKDRLVPELDDSLGTDIWIWDFARETLTRFTFDFAPEGRFFAYASDESGRYEVYVRPFPNIEDGSWQVSRDGGAQPLWAPDGRELFYVAADGKLIAVPVQIGDDFTSGNTEVVIARPYLEGYDISPDGQRFLRIKESGGAAGELVVVLNWVEELKRLVPTRN